jgi:hypothetical protein
MSMKILEAAAVQERILAALTLPKGSSARSVEALCGLLRRAGSALCPSSPRSLVSAVDEAIAAIAGEAEEPLWDQIEGALELAVAYGDFVEAKDVLGGLAHKPTWLYTAPPAFVQRDNGSVFLVGTAKGRSSTLPSELERRVVQRAHTRRLSPAPNESLRSILLTSGLIEIPERAWLRAPREETAEQHLARVNAALDALTRSGSLEGLTIIDPHRPARFYKKRWVTPRRQDAGRFVGRRKQAYGADLWCFVELEAGQPKRALDLPLEFASLRGCDEAWRLLAALDATRGVPQRYSIEHDGDGAIVRFFSPLPQWVQRRWDAVGERAQVPHCLFAYRFAKTDLDQETRFMREQLWLGNSAEQRGSVQ